MPEKFEVNKMENILIPDQKRFEELEKRFEKDGLDKVHVLADFDKTLTKAFVDGEEVPSVISILRDGSYLTPDYASKAHALYDKYHAFENDSDISEEERKRLMNEWWTTHFELLIRSGLKKEDIEKVAKSGKIKFRDGFLELADFLWDNDIPLVIMSSAGLGQESISLTLQREGLLSPNIYIISNSFEWDKNGKAVAVKQPIVHMANKDETLIKEFPDAFKAVESRRNVVLLGDNPSDTGMVKGFDYDALIKIGFLNKGEGKGYKEAYDALLLNDSSLDFVNNFLKRIKK